MPVCRLAAGTYRSGEVRGITAGRSRRADFAGEECWFRGLGFKGSLQHPSKWRSEEHTSELQSRFDLVCRLLLEKKTYHRSQDQHIRCTLRTRNARLR